MTQAEEKLLKENWESYARQRLEESPLSNLREAAERPALDKELKLKNSNNIYKINESEAINQ
jgi:hypothetical protein